MLNCLFSLSKLFYNNLLKWLVCQVRLEKWTLYNASITDHLLDTLLDNFALDLAAFLYWTQKKRNWAAWGFFLTPPKTSGKAWEDVLPLSKQKNGVAGFTITPEEFKKGAVTTPWIYLKRLVRQGICIIHRAQQKVRPNRHDPSKENIKMNSFLSWSVFCEKYFPVAVELTSYTGLPMANYTTYSCAVIS